MEIAQDDACMVTVKCVESTNIVDYGNKTELERWMQEKRIVRMYESVEASARPANENIN